ncbi:glutathione S-transferase [Cyanobacteria bacterium FACHB-472]|nr:glutathione S-transferase [Cyanobacteria bacterium FACHB-472]
MINLLTGEHRTPAFLAVNPAGKLPVLVDGVHSITESVAITLYLAENYPGQVKRSQTKMLSRPINLPMAPVYPGKSSKLLGDVLNAAP